MVIILIVNADLSFDGRIPEGMMEVTDMMMKNLDSIIEHDNRTIGAQQMQYRVLQWAVAHKDLLVPLARDGLIGCMEDEIERMKAERPSVAMKETT